MPLVRDVLPAQPSGAAAKARRHYTNFARYGLPREFGRLALNQCGAVSSCCIGAVAAFRSLGLVCAGTFKALITSIGLRNSDSYMVLLRAQAIDLLGW